jgi:hydrogenase maturation protease
VTRRVLVYGYGNPGRVDDGLGPALVDELARRAVPGVTLETDYQLQPEDAALVAKFDVVVFADADVSCVTPFELKTLEPRSTVDFSTHSVAPEAVLAMAHEHFGCSTTGFTLGMRGEEFDDFGERLSEQAKANLLLAADHLERAVREGTIFATAESVPCQR